VNPAVRAVKTIKTFSENVASLAKTPEDIAQAKSEVKRQLEIIDRQLADMQTKIDPIKREHVKDVATELFQTFNEVSRICQEPSVYRAP
jgi:hypothetical protein